MIRNSAILVVFFTLFTVYFETGCCATDPKVYPMTEKRLTVACKPQQSKELTEKFVDCFTKKMTKYKIYDLTKSCGMGSMDKLFHFCKKMNSGQSVENEIKCIVKNFSSKFQLVEHITVAGAAFQAAQKCAKKIATQ